MYVLAPATDMYMHVHIVRPRRCVYATVCLRWLCTYILYATHVDVQYYELALRGENHIDLPPVYCA